MEIERLSTGVGGTGDEKSLDNLLNGGIPKENIVLVTGEPGTGKSILSQQFLVQGARENQKGLYVSFEQPIENIIKSTGLFKWDFQKHLESGLIKVVAYDISDEKNDPQSVFESLMTCIEEFKPDRVVIDSLTTFIAHMEILTVMQLNWLFKDNVSIKDISPDVILRRVVIKLISHLRRKKITSLLISESDYEGKKYSKDGISEYFADGIILLRFIDIAGEQFGDIQVRKMRDTNHLHNPYTTIITDEGISLGEETVNI
jgi:circadian clock protein KaiC